MPIQRESKIPVSRLVLNRGLKALNVVIIIGGALTILMVLYLQGNPSFSPGWLLIFLGLLVMVGGLSGFGGTTLPYCYLTHILSLSTSAFGVLVFDLCLFGQREKVVDSFNSLRYSTSQVDKFLMSCSWAFLTLATLQIIAIIGRAILQRMTPPSFMTSEQTRDVRSATLSQIRQEIGDQAGRVDKTQANKIEDKFASKYGEWVNK